MTLPLVPLSLPAMTTTVSPFFTFTYNTSGASEMIFINFPIAQLTADRAEDAGAHAARCRS